MISVNTEKTYIYKGRDVLNEADVRVESLAIIDSLENCTITIR